MEKSPILKKITYAGCLLGLLIPIAAIIGWQTDTAFLKSLGNHHTAMNPATAIIFILYSSSLLIFTAFPSSSKMKVIASIVTGTASVVILVKIISFLSVDLKIDQVLFSHFLGADPSQPNRMAPNTVICFVFTGLSLFLINAKAPRKILAFQMTCFLTTLISFLVLIGYGYEAKEFIQVKYFIPMAFNSAVTFFFLSIGLMCARPDIGLMKTFMSSGSGGLMARRLLPVVVGMPALLGWLKVEGERHGLYDMEFGTALTIASMVIVFSFLIWKNACSLNLSDQRLQSVLKEVQALNHTLNDQNLKLQLLNEDLEAFSSSVSHDLQTPLRAIKGFSQIIVSEHGHTLSDEAKRLFGRIVNGSEKMSVLIDSLLRMSRVTRQEVKKVEVNLSELCGKIIENLKSEDSSRRLVFKIEKNLRACGDLILIEAAMNNLLGNAWKYSKHKPEAVIEVGVQELEGGRVFFVADNGAGFDMAYSKKLFGIFQRLHSEQEFAGTGVGLATVKRIIQKHGGRIWAEAKPGNGATFYFTL